MSRSTLADFEAFCGEPTLVPRIPVADAGGLGLFLAAGRDEAHALPLVLEGRAEVAPAAVLALVLRGGEGLCVGDRDVIRCERYQVDAERRGARRWWRIYEGEPRGSPLVRRGSPKSTPPTGRLPPELSAQTTAWLSVTPQAGHVAPDTYRRGREQRGTGCARRVLTGWAAAGIEAEPQRTVGSNADDRVLAHLSHRRTRRRHTKNHNCACTGERPSPSGIPFGQVQHARPSLPAGRRRRTAPGS